jgi:hypothetical protein
MTDEYRMDLVYHAINIVFDGKLFFAPVDNPQRIVDMGTGTGKYHAASVQVDVFLT